MQMRYFASSPRFHGQPEEAPALNAPTTTLLKETSFIPFTHFFNQGAKEQRREP
jgi:hypothetical protein